ncbi:hypothetical protein KUTeg_000529 [Tegillarca granosa]|uniref:Ras-related protein Rab-20 n=1 Tax=Tegillarca granosa TaxID=220873 RepID=A0ABQ9FXU0_TEGGR|nr:hypothetical protein KUTeg_000529 [Tegillarca granosa]
MHLVKITTVQTLEKDLKVIILGDYAVGKTAFICRYIEGKFKTQEPTIGAAFFLKQWGPYNIAVWDTAGGERYTGLSSFYCRNAGAAILAYDMSNSMGMKLDLMTPESRDITLEEGKKLARELNENIDISKLPSDPYFETSSLNGQHVNEVFEFIFQHCLPLTEAQRKAAFEKNSGTVELTEKDSTKKSCCSK